MDGIGKARKEDLPEILLLQKTAFGKVAEVIGNFDIAPLREGMDRLLEDYEQGIILKYTLDGKIAGSVRGRADKDGVCRVGKLIVHPACQNRGIGAALMAALENEFTASSAFLLFTGTQTPNTLHLYTKLGYVPVGEDEMGGVPMIILCKKGRG